MSVTVRPRECAGAKCVVCMKMLDVADAASVADAVEYTEVGAIDADADESAITSLLFRER